MNEGGWSVLEIIIVLILVIAILDRLSGNPVLTNPSNSNTTTTEPKKVVCDKITIRNPKSLEKIVITSQGVSVAGSVTSCATTPVDPDTFIVSVVDAQGSVTASPQEMYLSGVAGGWSFNHFAVFDVKPKVGTGYIIITRVTSAGVQVSDGGARLPVRFVNQ